MYTFIHIKHSFVENKCSNWKLYEKIEDAIEEINELETSSFEILNSTLSLLPAE